MSSTRRPRRRGGLRGERSGHDVERSLVASSVAPSYCKDGTVAREPDYLASADGKECAMPRLHCLTKDASACPQLSLLPPGFCKDGTVDHAGDSFVSSADGKQCALPSVHCLTKNPSTCPET